MPQNTQSWSVSILCYNEEGSIGSVLKSTHEFLKKELNADFEINVIDDGSTDNSAAEVETFIKENQGSKVNLIKHSRNLGIGMAIRTSYENSRFENVMAMCGDGQFQLEDLKENLEIKNGEFLCFYRKKKETYTIFRYFLSNTNRIINKLFFNVEIKDVNWVKAYKLSDLKKLDLKVTSSLVETEVVSKLIKKKLVPNEVQTVYLPRLAGEPKGASFKIVLLAAFDLIKLILVLKTSAPKT
ncbi:MAG: hypothetical protein CME61_04150 [Halobacteriovoraceae bacterium]|nr:hypothetical protein [Halobacteriovoraceae bacterium]